MGTMCSALREEATNGASYLAWMIDQVSPREPNNPPPMEEGIAVPMTIAFECIAIIMPSTGIPLDGELSFWISGIETSALIPRYRILEPGLWQPEVPEH